MDSGTPRILIVEDDRLLSFVEERLVSKLGYELAGKAADGGEAVQKAREEEPDLIIMDIRLDGSMDGIQAMKKIREFSKVPVIFLTGNNDDDTRERIKEISNCVNYFVKPINAADLRKPLKKVFKTPAESSEETQKSNGETSHVA